MFSQWGYVVMSRENDKHDVFAHRFLQWGYVVMPYGKDKHELFAHSSDVFTAE